MVSITPILLAIACAIVPVYGAYANDSIQNACQFLEIFAKLTFKIEGLWQIDQACRDYRAANPTLSSSFKGSFLVNQCDQMNNGVAGPAPSAPPAGFDENTMNGTYVDFFVQYMFTITFTQKKQVYDNTVAFVKKNCPSPPAQTLPPTTQNNFDDVLAMITHFAKQFTWKSTTSGEGATLYAAIQSACANKNQSALTFACSDFIKFCVKPSPVTLAPSTLPAELTTESGVEATEAVTVGVTEDVTAEVTGGINMGTTESLDLATGSATDGVTESVTEVVTEEVTSEVESSTSVKNTCGCVNGFLLLLEFTFGGACGCENLYVEKLNKYEQGGCWFCESGKTEADYELPCDDAFDFFIEIQNSKFKSFFKTRGLDKEYQSDVKVCEKADDDKKCMKQIRKKWNFIGKAQLSQCGCSDD